MKKVFSLMTPTEKNQTAGGRQIKYVYRVSVD